MCSSRARDARLAAERDQRERGERGEHRDERRRQVEAAVRALGDHVLLADQLAEVGDRLQQAHRPDAVGAVARLQPPDQLALEDGHEGEEPHQPVDQDERLDQRDEHAVGHQACPSTVHAPSTGAPSQAKRTAPGASVRESRAAPLVVPAGVTHRHGRTLGDPEAQRVRAREHDLVAALEREALGARDRGAGEERARARRRAGRRRSAPRRAAGAGPAARRACGAGAAGARAAQSGR